jgi:hypothetical protein
MEQLEILVGEWEMQAGLVGQPPWPGEARTTFEWLRGGEFLIERWYVPAAWDGIAVIGPGEEPSSLRRHYFDGRGEARVYEMSVEDGVWRQFRDADDPFPQRFEGRFVDDGALITARWEKLEDGVWTPDVDLTFRRAT